jgi:hypothetical protein
MKRYIQKIKDTHTTHERRQKAMRISGVLTAMLFAVWLGTLGVRLTAQFGSTAEAADNAETQVASVVSAVQSGEAQLQVSTTSVLSQ